MIKRLGVAVSVGAVLALGVASPALATVINGTSGPDTLVGTRKADVIHGFGGDDVLRGARGADESYGGRGNDLVGAGKDGKKDLVYGGPGRDRLVIWLFDHAFAGSGNDTVVVKMEGTEVFCGPGHDTAIVPRGALSFIHLHSCEVVVKVKGP